MKNALRAALLLLALLYVRAGGPGGGAGESGPGDSDPGADARRHPGAHA